jgi:RNA polymerase-binding transcription factor
MPEMVCTRRQGEFDLTAVEHQLCARRADLHERSGDLTRPPEGGGGVQFGKRIGDGTTEAVARFTDVGVAQSLAATEERVGRALEKIEEGTYGLCDTCGAPIANGRLLAAPESVECLSCARAPGRRRAVGPRAGTLPGQTSPPEAAK